MKIEIFNEGKRVINLVFPTAVIFNGLTAKIAARMIEKTLSGKSDDLAEDIDEEIHDLTEIAENLPESQLDSADITKLCAEIRRFKRCHPGFVLVEVEDESGDGVKITL